MSRYIPEQYEPEVLKRIQDLEKEMLADFSRICKEPFWERSAIKI